MNDRIGRLLDSIEQDAVSLTGFSHCLTGIAFSIAKAAKVIHDDSCKELVLKLVEEEDRYFQKDNLNWLDLRNDSHTLSPSYWC
ncbi:lanthionine synthetase LanC family protein, partial [Bacillus licheniformis]|uniref:lanthionine synthetase LanC family protein n=1 Tax=Bacillus licheniformis TaxID=1402 RepID=UPI00349FE686